MTTSAVFAAPFQGGVMATFVTRPVPDGFQASQGLSAREIVGLAVGGVEGDAETDGEDAPGVGVAAGTSVGAA